VRSARAERASQEEATDGGGGGPLGSPVEGGGRDVATSPTSHTSKPPRSGARLTKDMDAALMCGPLAKIGIEVNLGRPKAQVDANHQQ
jgi:hypothetical protein